MYTRRSFLIGGASLIAAPAIVRASSLMPVRAYDPLDGVYPRIDIKQFASVVQWDEVSDPRLMDAANDHAKDAFAYLRQAMIGEVRYCTKQNRIKVFDGTDWFYPEPA